MLLFGHIGITTGVIKAFELLGDKNRQPDARQAASGAKSITTILQSRITRIFDTIRNRISPIDYRFVSVGSLLPDIVDKPLWFVTGWDIFASGRDYGHTFLFSMVLLIAGQILAKHGSSRLLVLSLSSFMHLISDRIWNSPITLWWPLLGPFQKLETTGWISSLLRALFSRPSSYIPEIIGFIIVSTIIYRLVRRKSFGSFIRTGTIT